MATDLERLVVQLSADVRGYENALRRAGVTTDRQTKAIENRFRTMNKTLQSSMQDLSRSMTAGLGPLRGIGGAGGAAAVAAGAFVLLARETARVAQKMDDLADSAENIGIDVENLQGLTIAFRQLGGNVEDVIPGLQKFSEELGEAQRGTGELKKLFDANDISLKDAVGNWRPLNEMLREFADLVRGAPTKAMQQDLVKMATGARSLAPAFAAGGDAIEDLNQGAQKAGKAIDRELIKKASEFAERWKSGAEVAGGAWDQFFAGLAASTEMVIEDLQDLPRKLSAAVTATDSDEIQALKLQIDRINEAVQHSYDLAAGGSLVIDEVALAVTLKRLDKLQAKLEELQATAAATGRAYDPLSSIVAPAGAGTVMPVTGGGGGAGDEFLKTRAVSERIAGRIEKLDKEFADALSTLLQAFPELKINSAYRTFAEQAELYRQSQAGLIGPAARPGSSLHEKGLAVDININDLSAEEKERVRKMAEELGLEFPVSLRVNDPGHLQSAEPGMRAGFEAADEAARARTEAEKEVADALVTQNEALAEQNELINQLHWDRYLEERAATIEQQTAQLDAMRSLASDVFGGIVSDLRAGASAGEIFANVLDKILAKLGDMAVNMLTTALFGASGTTAPGLLGSLFTGGLAGARAGGGPVMAGSSYMVGEQGPEIFTPSVGGSILPNSQSRMGGELRGVIAVQPSPLFITSVQMATGRMISENNRRMPAYLADRQRRGI